MYATAPSSASKSGESIPSALFMASCERTINIKSSLFILGMFTYTCERPNTSAVKKMTVFALPLLYSHTLSFPTSPLWRTGYYSYVCVSRAVLMVLDLWQYQVGTWPGYVILIDLEGMTLSHLAKLDLQTMQQFLYFLQVTFNFRLSSSSN
jgi:hypothetical protein